MKEKSLIKEQINFYNYFFNDLRKEILFKLDSNNIFSYICENVTNILGFSSDEVIGKSIFDFIENQESYFDHDFEVLNNQDILFKHKNGNKIYMELQIKVIEDDSSAYGSMIDISRYKDMEYKEQKLKIVLENARDIIYRFQILPETKFVYVSPVIEQMFKYKAQKYYDNYKYIFKVSHPDDVHILIKKINGEVDYSKPIESRWIHKDGHYFWMEDYITPTYDSDGNLIAFEGVCRDISKRKALEEKLNYLTYHDSLTGLKNRTFYDNQIKELSTVKNLPVGVIVYDLDNLKIINDTMGHDKGDEMIKSVSYLLLHVKNDNISISRIGGDEFVVLIKNTSEFQVKEICRNINLLIENYNLNNRDYPIKLSSGYAFTENSVERMDEIFKIADRYMYNNKFNKRNKMKNVNKLK